MDYFSSFSENHILFLVLFRFISRCCILFFFQHKSTGVGPLGERSRRRGRRSCFIPRRLMMRRPPFVRVVVVLAALAAGLLVEGR